MAFIHQHKVVSFEAIDGHGLFLRFIGEFVHVDDLHGLAGEHRTHAGAVLVEQFGIDPRVGEFLEVLEAEALLGCE